MFAFMSEVCMRYMFVLLDEVQVCITGMRYRFVSLNDVHVHISIIN